MLSNKGGNDWALPSISFGQLDDMANSSEAWTKTVADEAWKEGAAHVLAGTFSLPFEECIYLFHYEETTQKYETINLLHLVTSGNEITGECYFWQPSAPGTMSQWTKDPWQFTIINGAGVEWAIEPHFEGQIPASMAQDYKEDAKSSYTKVICATMLLGHGGKSSEPIEYVSGVNRGRALGKLAPLPDTITVRFDHAAIRQAYPAGGFSGAKQPHDRRGHYRTLASGKVIPSSRQRFTAVRLRPVTMSWKALSDPAPHFRSPSRASVDISASSLSISAWVARIRALISAK